jgi:hypothetical protein
MLRIPGGGGGSDEFLRVAIDEAKLPGVRCVPEAFHLKDKEKVDEKTRQPTQQPTT